MSFNEAFDKIFGKPETRHKDVDNQAKRLLADQEIGIGSQFSGKPMAVRGAPQYRLKRAIDI